MALEALGTTGILSIDDLDKVPAVLHPCDHPVRVLRHRIGETMPCVRCELETGQFTPGRVIEPAGRMPPPRRGYAPPRRLGFVEGGYTPPPKPYAYLDRQEQRRKMDPRTHTQRLADEQAKDRANGIVVNKRKSSKHAGQGKGWANKQELIPGSIARLKQLVDERAGGWVTSKEFDQLRDEDTTVTARTLMRNTGKDWFTLMQEAGSRREEFNKAGKQAMRAAGHAAKKQRAQERKDATVAGMLMLAEQLGRTPSNKEWNERRDPFTTLSDRGVAIAFKMRWREWIREIGLKNVERIPSIDGPTVRAILKAEADRRGITMTALSREVPLNNRAVQTRWNEWRRGNRAQISLVREHFEALGLSVDEHFPEAAVHERSRG